MIGAKEEKGIIMADESFEVILANDEWSRRIHYQLRYQVFCLETGYEDPARFPDGQEKDAWDDGAAHFLVQEKLSGQWVAAMRLVLPDAEILPIEKRVEIESALRRDTRRCAEISRLCMVGHYRRRLQGRAMLRDGERFIGNGGDRGLVQPVSNKQQRTAEILKALLNAAVTLSAERGIDYWYMLTTRALAKILGYVLPMNMRVAGSPCWHRGERYPYLVDVGHVLHNMGELPFNRPAYRLHSDTVVAMPRVVGAD